MVLHERMPAERRRYPRTQLHMALQAIRLDPDGVVEPDEPLEMVDISRGGVGVMTSRPAYPGQRMLLRLPAPGMGVRNVCATVRRCSKVSDQYRLGIEFDSPVYMSAAETVPAVTVAA